MSAQIHSFESPKNRQLPHCGGISECEVHFEQANQKPPMTASCDTKADLIYTFRKYFLLVSEFRIFRKKVFECARHGSDSLNTNAVPIFPQPPHTGGKRRSNPPQVNRYKRYDHGILFTNNRCVPRYPSDVAI